MEIEAREASPGTSADRNAVCPFLGLRHDDATAASYATRSHACFHSSRPAAIRLDVQTRFCLADQHPRCPVYTGAAKRPPRPRWTVPAIGRRQAAAFALFAVLIPALLGALLAVFSGDDGGDAPSAAVTAPAALRPADGDAAAAAAVRPVEVTGIGGDDARAIRAAPADAAAGPTDAPAVSEAASALDRLLGWENVLAWTVEPGDTLLALADTYGTTVEAIAVYNGLADAFTILSGESLSIPVGFAAPLGEEVAATVLSAPPAAEGAEPLPLVAPEELLNWPNIESWEVLDGDNLAAIARDFDTTVEAITLYNEIDPVATLFVGAVVLVPVGYPPGPAVEEAASEDGGEGEAVTAPAAPATPDEDPLAALRDWPEVMEVTVASGDSLFSIAQRFSTSVEAIAFLNDIDPRDPLFAGATVLVPVGFAEPLSLEAELVEVAAPGESG